MNLNADIGEGAGEDEAVLACIDSANVACGVHAGSPSLTIATARRCKALGIQVGAHPGYDDRAGFGRIERSLAADEIEALIAYQVAALAAVAPIAYIKPHGALYHRCQRDAASADGLARVAKTYGVGLMGQPGFEIVAAATRAGLPVYREGFADRLMLQPCAAHAGRRAAESIGCRPAGGAPCPLGSLRHDLRPRRYTRRGTDRVVGPRRAAGGRHRDCATRWLNPAGALALKLVLTPALVGAASLAGRRWGSAVGGWLIGIPFTSGPIAFFLALDPGPDFAARAAAGVMAGAISQAAFCVAYAWTAQRWGWTVSLIAAAAGFVAITIVLNAVALPTAGFFVVIIVVIVVSLFLMPQPAPTRAEPIEFPAWDLPARMLVATAFVVVLTAAARCAARRAAGALPALRIGAGGVRAPHPGRRPRHRSGGRPPAGAVRVLVFLSGPLAAAHPRCRTGVRVRDSGGAGGPRSLPPHRPACGARMSMEIRELHDIEDLEVLAKLFSSIWGRTGEPPINSDILKALALSGNYLSGAFADGRLIGGLVGWLGGAPPHDLHMHSHILGVLPGSERHGLGFELKQHQRSWCLARGVKVMEWTTDPLVRRNAYFNLTKLGAEAPEYLVNVYGQMRDGINAAACPASSSSRQAASTGAARALITWLLR